MRQTWEDDDDTPAPEGVELLDPDDSVGLRKSMEKRTLNAFDRFVNGYEYGGVRLELKNIHLADKERYTLAEQNDAKLRDKFLARRIRADVNLIDTTTNEVLDSRKKFTLGRLPYLTDDRGTIIHNGSEYTPVHQLRLLPGAYTRKTQAGELETHWNVRPGTGAAMRVSFSPETAQYRVQVGKSSLHAYSFFRDLGVTDEELERRWGPEILAANKSRYDKRALDRAYTRAVPKWERDESLDAAAKAEAVKAALGRAQVATSVIQRTLPNLFSAEKAASWRMAHVMEKFASHRLGIANGFSPDLAPTGAADSILDFDFEGQHVAVKAAAFHPDLTADDMREAVNSIYGGRGPRLASMKSWPAKWLDSEDTMGWLQWYENYANGRRSDNDERQIKRWQSFKQRHGAAFIANPTPRRAFALRNWAIDPLKLLAEDKREEFAKVMDSYKDKAHATWALRRASDNALQRLVDVAAERGFAPTGDLHADVLTAAETGALKSKEILQRV